MNHAARLCLVGLLLPLSACSTNPSPTTSYPSQTAPVTRSSPSTIKTGVSLANFSKIQVAIQPDDYASTIEQVNALFGEPDKVTHTTIRGVDLPIKNYQWSRADQSLGHARVQVLFANDEVIAKKYFQADLPPRTKRTPTTLTAVQLGTPLERVYQQFGLPTTLSIMGRPGPNRQIIAYDQFKSAPTTKVSLNFQQGQLEGTNTTQITP